MSRVALLYCGECPDCLHRQILVTLPIGLGATTVVCDECNHSYIVSGDDLDRADNAHEGETK